MEDAGAIDTCVIKPEIAGDAMSMARRAARDVLLGLTKTCSKLGVSFFHSLGDRLRVSGTVAIPPPPDLARLAASTA